MDEELKQIVCDISSRSIDDDDEGKVKNIIYPGSKEMKNDKLGDDDDEMHKKERKKREIN